MLRKYFVRLSTITIVILSGVSGFFYLNRLKLINESKPLNLIIISIDTLRTDHMGIYGYNKNTTPNIDKWAKNAVVFSNAVAIMPTTYSSFASLMTGQHATSTGITNSIKSKPLSQDTITLAKILKENNYHTAAFITNHSLLKEITNLDNGFDIYNFNTSDSNTDNYNNPKYYQLFDDVKEYLKINKNNKFFLWIHLMDPHSPYMPPNDKKCLFNKKFCSLIESKSLKEWEKERLEFSDCQPNDIPMQMNETLQTLYDGEIYQVDQMINVILNQIKSNNLDNKSLIILYGDHGESFEHKHFFNHGTVLYQSSINIPLIIKHPYITINKKIDRLVENTDIFPTILDILKIPINHHIDGISFADLFLNKTNNYESHKVREYSFLLNTGLNRFAIYDGRYKYIYSNKDLKCLENNQNEELYDIKNDWNELDNLILNKDNLHNILTEKLNSSKSQIEAMGQNTDYNLEINKYLDKLKSLGY